MVSTSSTVLVSSLLENNSSLDAATNPVQFLVTKEDFSITDQILVGQDLDFVQRAAFVELNHHLLGVVAVFARLPPLHGGAVRVQFGSPMFGVFAWKNN
jgi:hypothetical protein